MHVSFVVVGFSKNLFHILCLAQTFCWSDLTTSKRNFETEMVRTKGFKVDETYRHSTELQPKLFK